MEQQASGALMEPLTSNDSLGLPTGQRDHAVGQHQALLAKLQEATQAQAGSPAAELLSAAAAALQQLSKQLDAVQSELAGSKEDNVLVKPSAWLTRENKYKKDLLALRRTIQQQEEEAERMRAELQAASSGTLVEKLRADVKALEQQVSEHKTARAELSSQMSELKARTTTLLGVSPALGPVWKDICAGKRVAHTALSVHPQLSSGRSLEAAMDAEHGAAATPGAGATGSDGGLLPTAGDSALTDLLGLGLGRATSASTGNSTISEEHLSVSAAKAKFTQRELLAAGGRSMPAHLHSAHSAHSALSSGPVPLRPVATEGRTGSGAGRAASLVSKASSGRQSGATTPTARNAGSGALFADDTTLPLPPQAAGPTANDDDDSQLIDLDDLLSAPSQPEGVMSAVSTGGASAPAVPSTPPLTTTSTACGRDSPFSQVDAAAQVLVRSATADVGTLTDAVDVQDVGTDTAGGPSQLVDAGTSTELMSAADAATQSDTPAGAALADAQTQSDAPQLAEVADAAAQCEAATLMDSSTQAEPVAMESVALQADFAPATPVAPPPPTVCDMATQTSLPLASMQADAEVQVVLLAVPDVDVGVQVAPPPVTQLSTATSVTDLLATLEPPPSGPRDADAAAAAAAAAAACAGAAAIVTAVDAPEGKLESRGSGTVAAAQAEAARWEAVAQAAQAELTAAREAEGRLAAEVHGLRGQLEALGRNVEDVETEGMEALLAAEEDLKQVKEELGRVKAELAAQAAGAQAALEQVRASAARSSHELAVAQAELARVRAELAAAHSEEERMRLELQAYQHTMDGLRVAVEEADLEKQMREAQNMQLAEKLATMTEFLQWKTQTPKHAAADLGTWLKRRPSMSLRASASAVHEDVQRTDVTPK